MPAVPALPVPTPAPTDGPGYIARSILHGVLEGFLGSPILIALVVLVVVTGAVRSARSVIHSRHAKDPLRRFTGADRRVIFERAGNRCESFGILGRCRETSGLQADHVHPHSRGGSTWIGNGQALCKQHNRAKSARVPWDFQLARIEKRRADYFAEGHERAVVRYRPAA